MMVVVGVVAGWGDFPVPFLPWKRMRRCYVLVAVVGGALYPVGYWRGKETS